jgi:hypothetical protein
MFKLFSDIYFVVYKLYYVGQNNNLDIRVSLKNWDKGSTRIYEYGLPSGVDWLVLDTGASSPGYQTVFPKE